MTNLLMSSKIKLYKNVFSDTEIKNIQIYLSSANWSFGHYSDMHSKHKCFWNMNLSDIEYFNTHLHEIIRNLIKDGNLGIERIYANGQTYGLDGSFHTDMPYGYTFLYYANLKWEKEWGGSTIFYDPTTKEKKYFDPEPNTAIFFPGNILHYGQSPSRDFYELRTTIAYKFFKLSTK